MSERDYNETFPKNYLVSTAFEIRFDPILVITNKIAEIQNEIRTDFPSFNETFSVPLFTKDTSFDKRWEFVNDNKQMSFRVDINKIALIQRNYSEYKDFIEICQRNFNIFLEFFKISKFSRLGLRYTNEIPLKEYDNQIEQTKRWFNLKIKDDLVDTSSIINYQLELRKKIEDINLISREKYILGKDNHPYYVLDFDAFILGEISNYEENIIRLHDKALEEFHFSVKDEFLDHLRGVD